MHEVARLFTRSDVERLLDVATCIDAVEQAFRMRGQGHATPSGVLGVHVPGGGFHAKAAFLELSRPYVAVKVNANFPGNPAAHALPTIQGVLALFDARTGVPLALMDSMSITTLRTAAASAVAARYLSRPDSRTATFVGCGVQARAHVAAISAVRQLERVMLYDIDESRAQTLATELRARYPFSVSVAGDPGEATRASEIIVTSTSATHPFLGIEDLSPGSFVAAVGADSEHKQELDPALLAAHAVVVDDLEQCATIGDLHHALDTGVMTRDDVRASLAEVVAGTRVGRRDADEIVIFDSTGVAIEDVAAAVVVYESAVRANVGGTIMLGS